MEEGEVWREAGEKLSPDAAIEAGIIVNIVHWSGMNQLLKRSRSICSKSVPLRIISVAELLR